LVRVTGAADLMSRNQRSRSLGTKCKNRFSLIS